MTEEHLEVEDPLRSLVIEMPDGVDYTLRLLRERIRALVRENVQDHARVAASLESGRTALLEHHAWHHERYRQRPDATRVNLDHPHSDWLGGESLLCGWEIIAEDGFSFSCTKEWGHDGLHEARSAGGARLTWRTHEPP